MKFISPKEYLAAKDSLQLLDVREAYEFDICSIGGIKIPMDEVSNRISELNPKGLICVMCKTGKRAAAVANLLETDFGFTQVYVLEGGIMGYAEQVDGSIEKYD